jgi:hypothetical protein
MEAEGREGRGGEQRKEMRRRVIMWVLAITLHRKFYTEIPRNETVRPISTFLYLAAIYIFPRLVLFGNSIFLYCVRELLAHPEERREGQGTAANQWLAAVPCPPLHSCG